MALSSSTLKPIFNVGSFNVSTGLTIPSTSLSNKLSFSLPLPIYPQEPSVEYFSTLPVNPSFSVLAKVLFDDEEIYKNAQFDSPPAAVPTAPDVEIRVWGIEDPPENEQIDVIVPIPMILNSNGLPKNGKYEISLIYVFQDDNLDWFAETVTYAPIKFFFKSEQPELTFSYDSSPSAPFLTLSDITQYEINGITADNETEFVMFPPENGAEITTTTEDNQSITFSSFKTGGNELKTTTLLTYDFTTFDIVSVVQGYEAFTIYLINNCAIYDCLDELYTKFKTVDCNTKAGVISQQKLIEANAIGLKLLTGQGCDKSLSTTLSQFQALCGCECDCLDDTPRVIQAAIAVETSGFQIVTAIGSNTVIDLAAGRKVRLITAINTEIFIDSDTIVDFEGYQIEITASAGTPDVTWDSDTIGWTGGAPVTSQPTVGSYDIYEFTGNTTLSKIMLTSSSLDVN